MTPRDEDADKHTNLKTIHKKNIEKKVFLWELHFLSNLTESLCSVSWMMSISRTISSSAVSIHCSFVGGSFFFHTINTTLNSHLSILCAFSSVTYIHTVRVPWSFQGYHIIVFFAKEKKWKKKNALVIRIVRSLPIFHTCTAAAYSIYSHISLLLIKQNRYFSLLYFDVHLTKSDPLLFPLLAHYITPSLQRTGDLCAVMATKQSC